MTSSGIRYAALSVFTSVIVWAGCNSSHLDKDTSGSSVVRCCEAAGAIFKKEEIPDQLTSKIHGQIVSQMSSNAYTRIETSQLLAKRQIERAEYEWYLPWVLGNYINRPENLLDYPPRKLGDYHVFHFDGKSRNTYVYSGSTHRLFSQDAREEIIKGNHVFCPSVLPNGRSIFIAGTTNCGECSKFSRELSRQLLNYYNKKRNA